MKPDVVASLHTVCATQRTASHMSMNLLQDKQNGAASRLSAAGLLVAVGNAHGGVRAVPAATARHVWSAQNCNEGCASEWLFSTYIPLLLPIEETLAFC